MVTFNENGYWLPQVYQEKDFHAARQLLMHFQIGAGEAISGDVQCLQFLKHCEQLEPVSV